MKTTVYSSGDNAKILENFTQREKQENHAAATLTKETLSSLNIKPESLPPKCQMILNTLTDLTKDPKDLDPIVLSLRHSRRVSEEMEQDYEIMQLRQKNKRLDVKIERNKTTINDLRRELVEAQTSLQASNPGPTKIHDAIRQMAVKVTSYEESLEKAKAKFTKQGISEVVYPKSLEVLVSQLTALKMEESELKARAEDVALTRELKENIVRIKSIQRQNTT